jgi:hypothetical protein
MSMVIVLPLILNRFSPAEISVFFLFSSIITLQLFFAASFGHTFARVIGYVLAGATLSQIQSPPETWSRNEKKADGNPVDRRLLADLLVSMDRIFNLLALVTIPLLLILGWFCLSKPIASTAEPWRAWLAWAAVIAVTPFVVGSLKYTAFLQGANQVALEQRWAASFVVGGLVTGIVAVLAGGGLLGLILANQFWQIASVLRLRWLYRSVLHQSFEDIPSGSYCPEAMRSIWPAAWRSVVGSTSAMGTTVLGSLWFAQVLPEKPLAELLFGVRVMNIISELCRAPFYSQLPVLNTLRIRGAMPSIIAIAKRGMRRSYFAFLILFIVAPIVAHYALPLIQSQIVFPTIEFWLCLGAAMLLERFGSMHANLYSTTNHIITHWLNGLTMVISLVAMIALTQPYGILAYPLGTLIAMLGFYAWNAVRYSLKSIQQTLWQFERDVFAPVASLQTIGSVALFCWSRS